MNQYYLYIERLTQNKYSGDPETPVAVDRIDPEKNLHVYLTGNIAAERSVQLRTVRVPTFTLGGTQDDTSPGSVKSATTYKASLSHYTLSNASKYVLNAVDDESRPYAIASIDIQTI